MRTLFLIALLVSGSLQAQAIKVGELNSYKVFPAFLEPYKKGWELALEEIARLGEHPRVLARDLESQVELAQLEVGLCDAGHER